MVIADVAGKGIAAALLMAFARPVIHHGASPRRLVRPTRSSGRIASSSTRRHTALFITALAGRLESATGHVRLANAGHEPPLLVPGDDGPIVEIATGGPLLGAFRHSMSAEIEAWTSAPATRLVLYTDGVTDSQAVSGERFDERGLLDGGRASSGRDGPRPGGGHPATPRCRSAAAPSCADDVTIVAVGRHRDR